MLGMFPEMVKFLDVANKKLISLSTIVRFVFNRGQTRKPLDAQAHQPDKPQSYLVTLGTQSRIFGGDVLGIPSLAINASNKSLRKMPSYVRPPRLGWPCSSCSMLHWRCSTAGHDSEAVDPCNRNAALTLSEISSIAGAGIAPCDSSLITRSRICLPLGINRERTAWCTQARLQCMVGRHLGALHVGMIND